MKLSYFKSVDLCFATRDYPIFSFFLSLDHMKLEPVINHCSVACCAMILHEIIEHLLNKEVIKPLLHNQIFFGKFHVSKVF